MGRTKRLCRSRVSSGQIQRAKVHKAKQHDSLKVRNKTTPKNTEKIHKRTAKKSPSTNVSQNGVSKKSDDKCFQFSEQPTIKELRQRQAEFAKERNWDQYHTPRNILLALVGEVGELAEIFQWRGEVEQGLPGWTNQEREKLEHEIADVFLYLIRLAEKCRVDLPTAAAAKMALNAVKYPASKVFGSSKKYTEYQNSEEQNSEEQ